MGPFLLSSLSGLGPMGLIHQHLLHHVLVKEAKCLRDKRDDEPCCLGLVWQLPWAAINQASEADFIEASQLAQRWYAAPISVPISGTSRNWAGLPQPTNLPHGLAQPALHLK
ncbi:unnamed protein product [Leuciscus chuanchicus]